LFLNIPFGGAGQKYPNSTSVASMIESLKSYIE